MSITPVRVAIIGGGIIGCLTAWRLKQQGMQPVIIERINSYFGYRAVARLSMIRGPLPPRRDPAPEAPPVPDAAALESAAERAAGITDEFVLPAAIGVGAFLLFAFALSVPPLLWGGAADLTGFAETMYAPRLTGLYALNYMMDVVAVLNAGDVKADGYGFANMAFVVGVNYRGGFKN